MATLFLHLDGNFSKEGCMSLTSFVLELGSWNLVTLQLFNLFAMEIGRWHWGQHLHSCFLAKTPICFCFSIVCEGSLKRSFYLQAEQSKERFKQVCFDISHSSTSYINHTVRYFFIVDEWWKHSPSFVYRKYVQVSDLYEYYKMVDEWRKYCASFMFGKWLGKGLDFTRF